MSTQLQVGDEIELLLDVGRIRAGQRVKLDGTGGDYLTAMGGYFAALPHNEGRVWRRIPAPVVVKVGVRMGQRWRYEHAGNVTEETLLSRNSADNGWKTDGVDGCGLFDCFWGNSGESAGIRMTFLADVPEPAKEAAPVLYEVSNDKVNWMALPRNKGPWEYRYYRHTPSSGPVPEVTSVVEAPKRCADWPCRLSAGHTGLHDKGPCRVCQSPAVIPGLGVCEDHQAVPAPSKQPCNHCGRLATTLGLCAACTPYVPGFTEWDLLPDA